MASVSFRRLFRPDIDTAQGVRWNVNKIMRIRPRHLYEQVNNVELGMIVKKLDRAWPAVKSYLSSEDIATHRHYKAWRIAAAAYVVTVAATAAVALPLLPAVALLAVPAAAVSAGVANAVTRATAGRVATRRAARLDKAIEKAVAVIAAPAPQGPRPSIFTRVGVLAAKPFKKLAAVVRGIFKEPEEATAAPAAPPVEAAAPAPVAAEAFEAAATPAAAAASQPPAPEAPKP